MGKTFRAGHVFYPVVFPQAVAVAEGGDAGFGGYAGTGKDGDFFHGRVESLRFQGRFAPVAGVAKQLRSLNRKLLVFQ